MIALDIGRKTETTPKMQVSVADGNKVINNAMCSEFVWSMQGYKFLNKMRLLPLGGCDAVFGVDWMRQFSPITMDFNKLRLMFDRDGKKVVLKGTRSKTLGMVQQLTVNSFAKVIKKASFDVVGQLFSLSIDGTGGISTEENFWIHYLLNLLIFLRNQRSYHHIGLTITGFHCSLVAIQ